MAKAGEVYGSDMGPIFNAKHPGRCGGCSTPFGKGDLVFYVSGELYAADGCDANDFDSFNQGREPGIAVIPRKASHGRTDLVGSRGACPECFQIPAANGACDAGCTRSMVQ